MYNFEALNLTSSARKSTKYGYRPRRSSWANPFDLQHIKKTNGIFLSSTHAFQILHYWHNMMHFQPNMCISYWKNVKCMLILTFGRGRVSKIWDQLQNKTKVHFIHYRLILNSSIRQTNKIEQKKIRTIYGISSADKDDI